MEGQVDKEVVGARKQASKMVLDSQEAGSGKWQCTYGTEFVCMCWFVMVALEFPSKNCVSIYMLCGAKIR